mgnify:FL=1
MRTLKAIIAMLFALAGILIGALNQQVVDINLVFTHYQAHLGLVLLLCMLSGAVLGGALASVGLLLRGGKWIPDKPANKPEQTQESRS